MFIRLEARGRICLTFSIIRCPNPTQLGHHWFECWSYGRSLSSCVWKTEASHLPYKVRRLHVRSTDSTKCYSCSVTCSRVVDYLFHWQSRSSSTTFNQLCWYNPIIAFAMLVYNIPGTPWFMYICNHIPWIKFSFLIDNKINQCSISLWNSCIVSQNDLWCAKATILLIDFSNHRSNLPGFKIIRKCLSAKLKITFCM